VFVSRCPRFTEEGLREAVAVSLSYSDTLRRLEMRTAGGNHRTLQKYVRLWDISVEHFDPDAARVKALARGAIPLEEILIEHSTYSRGHVKARLYEAGVKERRCELCGQDENWRGNRMALILDHINGVADDNRLANLRVVCPNCAATFETHCGRANRRPARVARCPDCGVEFRPTDKRRRYCSRVCGQRRRDQPRRSPQLRKVERPPHDQLVREIAETSWSAVGRKYGVSDNAVRKWVRRYEAEAAA
jgi:ferredoxin